MTGALLRGKDLIGQPVVDVTTGDDLAEIRDIVFDPSTGTVGGFTLNKRGFLGGRMKVVLEIDAVRSVGTHAVMVASADALTDRADAPEHVGSPDRERNVLADMVITESGRQLGTVRDVVVLGGPSPRVVGFEIGDGPVGDGLIPIQSQTGVSGSALIVPDAFEGRVRTDLTGLAAELAEIEGSRS